MWALIPTWSWIPPKRPNSGGSLEFASFATGTWVISTIDSYAQNGVSMAKDSNDKLHLACKRDDDYLYYYTNTSGSWVISSWLYNMSYAGFTTSIAVDPGDKEHIAWCYQHFTADPSRLNYATNSSGSWANTQIDTEGDVGKYCSIAVDSYYYSHISYYDATNGNLKYATNSSGSWVTQTLFSEGDTGLYTSIAVDNSDYIHISYYYATAGFLKYATNLSGSWVSETVDASPGVGQYTSLALDDSGLVRISYYDSTEGALKFAYQTVPSPTPSLTPFGYKTPTPTPTAPPTATPPPTVAPTAYIPSPTVPPVPTATPLTTPPPPTPPAGGPPWIYDYNGDGRDDIGKSARVVSAPPGDQSARGVSPAAAVNRPARIRKSRRPRSGTAPRC